MIAFSVKNVIGWILIWLNEAMSQIVCIHNFATSLHKNYWAFDFAFDFEAIVAA